MTRDFFVPSDITDAVLAKTGKLNDLAQSRGQTLAQMALAWVLRHKVVTSALIGASKVSQVDDCVGATSNLNFTGRRAGKHRADPWVAGLSTDHRPVGQRKFGQLIIRAGVIIG